MTTTELSPLPNHFDYRIMGVGGKGDAARVSAAQRGKPTTNCNVFDGTRPNVLPGSDRFRNRFRPTTGIDFCNQTDFPMTTAQHEGDQWGLINPVTTSGVATSPRSAPNLSDSDRNRSIFFVMETPLPQDEWDPTPRSATPPPIILHRPYSGHLTSAESSRLTKSASASSFYTEPQRLAWQPLTPATLYDEGFGKHPFPIFTQVHRRPKRF